MAEQGYFYHVTYQFQTGTGMTYGDLSITMRTRIDSDAKLLEIRSAIAGEQPANPGQIVLTGITLLARVDVPQTTGGTT